MSDDSHGPMRPQAALSHLLAGNERFRTGKALHPHQTVMWRQTQAAGQQPVAAILTCADSRVSPEIIFDQGLGDLYVIRVAGNTVTPSVLGGLEFAIEALCVPLMVVLGHENCAAVAAALASLRPAVELPVSLPAAWRAGWLADGSPAPGQLEAVLSAIRPALHGPAEPGLEPLTAAIHANIRAGVAQLKGSALVGPRLAAGEVAVVGAHYGLATGQVSLIVP